ncbi:cytochrome b [Rhodococcus sp. SRB_17]|nr:cytochrome b [Rhodococcus sp. SRB_17]
MAHTVRIWDLPTRIFHWALAASVTGLVVSAKLGGNAMVWHLRLGYVVLALLLFRLVWGLVGGHWSRFSRFLYAPSRVLRYLRGQGHPEDSVAHSPLGALSVFALLAALALQVGSGLFSDDEIAFAGPLTRFVSSNWVGQATAYHKDIGQYLVLALVALHLLAIAFYVFVKKRKLVRPMLVGDKVLPVPVPASRDDAGTHLAALTVLALSAGAVAWLVQWGG